MREISPYDISPYFSLLGSGCLESSFPESMMETVLLKELLRLKDQTAGRGLCPTLGHLLHASSFNTVETHATEV